MELVVFGANGLLGSNVVAAAAERGHDVVGAYHSTEPEFDIPLRQVDITEPSTVREVLTAVSPEGVVNCAAMTDVDACEANAEAAFAVNAEAPATIAKTCDAEEIWLGHVSTDYVFDGRSESRYTEAAPTQPLQEYGAAKLAGEQGVMDIMSGALITRLSFIWGIHRSRETLTGFPRWVRDSLSDGDSIPLFTDQYITPTRAGQAASVLVELFERGASGIMNIASRSCITPYAFGRSIRQRLENPRGTCEESSLSALDRAAERPRHTCLAIDRIERELSRSQPTVAEDLSAVESYI